MSAGRVSTAAMLAAPATASSSRRHQHCPAEEWQAYVEENGGNRQYRLMRLRFRGKFVERWPALASWYGEPLAQRVGRLYGEAPGRPSFPVSFRARSYLVYLALRGYTTLDYPWLLASGHLATLEPAAKLGIDLGTGQLVDDVTRLGFERGSARQAMHWSVARIALHTGVRDVAAITEDHIAELLAAIRFFAERLDFELFYPSRRRLSTAWRKAGSPTCTSSKSCSITVASSTPSHAS